MLRPPKNTTLYETPVSTHWFDESGILCGISKRTERTLEHYQKVIDLYKVLTKKRGKLCILADPTNSMPIPKEVNLFISTEHPKYLKAMAILSNEPLGNTQVDTFIKLSWTGFPVMKFWDEKEARKWLMSYL